MNIGYQWLSEYIKIGLTPEELQEKMTFSGIEVEKVSKTGDFLKQIIIAKIIDIEQHPDADKLSVCKVDCGKPELLQVVCGAPNCIKNLKVAFAPVGTKFDDFVIKKAKLRGVSSFGMICSESELGLSDNHDGIMELSDDAPIGKSLSEYLGAGDTIFEVEITPNRPDLLGMVGVARDLSALLNKKLIFPKLYSEDGKKVNEIDNYLKVDILEPKLCNRYCAIMIKDVKIKESPEWLRKRLTSVGIKSINNVVDITNYVMLELGHPLHAFDYNKLLGKEIKIRKANNNEKIKVLNNIEYSLNNQDLIIADSQNPIAIAGIIGGADSCIDDKTTDVVVEIANFNYQSIRKTGNYYKINTDSSYRFERGMSAETVDIVRKRVAQLFLDIVDCSLVSGVIDKYPNEEVKSEIKLRFSRIKRILGFDLGKDKIITYLENLGLEKIDSSNEDVKFLIPANRNDLTREIDLIEEVIRLNGYNNIPSFVKEQKIMKRRSFDLRRKIEDIFVDNGFNQAINLTFADPEDLSKLDINDDDSRRETVNIKNPLGFQSSILRSSLLPNLLKTVSYNINHNQKDLKLFELDKIFIKNNEKLPQENFQVTALCCGNFMPEYWKEQSNQVDFYDIKGIVDEILSEFDGVKIKLEKSLQPYYLDGQAADLFFNKEYVGSLGKLDTKILKSFDIDIPLFAIELNLDTMLLNSKNKKLFFSEIPKFPVVSRDISFIVGKSYDYKKIKSIIEQTNLKLIYDVSLKDEYIGKGISEGNRSLTFSLKLMAKNKTLTEDAITKVVDNVFFKLEKNINIIKR